MAIIRGVLHHLADQQLAIKNAFNLAGHLIIMEPNGTNPILKVMEKTSQYPIEHEEEYFFQWELKKVDSRRRRIGRSLVLRGVRAFFLSRWAGRSDL